MTIRGRAASAFAAALIALITASDGCVSSVYYPWRAPDIVTIGADIAFKRPATYPNLTLSAAGPEKAKITVAPCSTSTGSEGVSSEDRICANLAVKNDGFGPTEGATEVLVSLDGAPLETWVIPAAIRPGDVVNRQPVSFGPLAPGAHVLRVVIDPDNRIAETSETDNDATAPFFVSSR
jgi:hypothetical protein